MTGTVNHSEIGPIVFKWDFRRRIYKWIKIRSHTSSHSQRRNNDSSLISYDARDPFEVKIIIFLTLNNSNNSLF